jgi:low temperature requirement protein LtrA
MTTTSLHQTVAERRATWLELFFDLVFAAAVAEVSGVLGSNYTLSGMVEFGFLFLMIWSAWVGHTLFSSRFDTDDGVQRLLTLAQMFAVAVMAVNAEGPLGGRTSAGFAAAYGGMRLVLAAQYLRAQHRQPGDLAGRFARLVGAGAVLWLLGAVMPRSPGLLLWGLALALDLATPWLLHDRSGLRPHHPAHLPERFGLFTLILLGESLAAMMAGMKQHEYWSAPAAATAIAGILLAFGIWWSYFHGIRAADPRPVRSARDALLQQRCIWAHLPLCFGIALTAVGVEHLISHGTHGVTRDAGLVLLAGGAMLAGALGVIGSSRSHRN